MSRVADRVYAEVKGLVLTGALPFNEYLAEERLARTLGCSRTPVRAAFLRLETEGFLERDPVGHFRPRAPEMDRMRDLYAVRSALERLAVELAADPDALAGLHEEWAALEAGGQDDSFVYLDESFHLGIAAASRNRPLLDLLRQLNEQIRIVRIHDFMIPGRVEATIAQHRAILDCLLAGQRTRAADLMAAHIAESAAHVEGAVVRIWQRAASAPTALEVPR